MKYRINWHLVDDKNANLRFKYYPGCINYKNYQYNPSIPVEKLRMINVFEKYVLIANKEKFLVNFLKYCNEYEINPFNYIPFTVIINKGKNFEKITKSLEQLISSKEPNNYEINSYSNNFPISVLTLGTSKPLNYIPIYISPCFISNENLWIVKPPDLFQGMGIKLAKDIENIKYHCKNLISGIDKLTAEQEERAKKMGEEPKPTKYKTSNILIQKYLDNPLLYRNRKFDIRCYVLIDYCLNVFVCKEGHLKACSKKYDINDIDLYKHITNYSYQKKCEDFAKFEQGNEISYKSLIESLNEQGMNGKKIFEQIYSGMKEEIQLSMNAVGRRITNTPNALCFQIFGYDFIVDKNFKPWILEINDNPGLSISSELISHLVPRMVDDALRLTVDKVFPTIYSNEVVDENGKYKSMFKLDGYDDEENVFEFLCNVNIPWKKNENNNISINCLNNKNINYNDGGNKIISKSGSKLTNKNINELIKEKIGKNTEQK